MKIKTLTLLLLLLIFMNSHAQQKLSHLDCIIWKNSYVSIEKQRISSSEINLIFIVRSRQATGWISVGFFSKPNYFEDSTNIMAFLPNNFVEFTNHSTISNKTIFGETFQKRDINLIDGTFSFAFKMNFSQLKNKNYLAFAQNSYNSPTITNGIINIPKHQIFSNFMYFDLNSTKSIPICIPELNLSGRIVSQHYIGFILGLICYIILGLLYVMFRDHEPFKSRFIGPYIALGSVTFNLFIETILIVLPYEKTSKAFCILVPFFSFGSLQVA